MVQLLSVGPARAATVWGGSLTAASVDDSFPVLGESTWVRFSTSEPGGPSVKVAVFRDGVRVNDDCLPDGQTERTVWANPAPGQTQEFYAQVSVQLGGQWVQRDRSATVLVTDPGWLGSVAAASVDDSFPVLGESTWVRFSTSEPGGPSVKVAVFRDGVRVSDDCLPDGQTECTVWANPAPGQTQEFYAQVSVQLGGQWVQRDRSATVLVTDPGWQGIIAPSASNAAFVDPGKSTTISFDVSEPLDFARVEIYVDGALESSCYSAGQTSCGISVQFPDGPPHVVKAVVRAQRAGGWEDISSASAVVSTQSPEQLADFLLTATPVELEAALGTVLATEVTALQQATRGPSFCLSLGLQFPTYRLRSSVPDLTFACMAGTAAVIAYLLKEVGLPATLQGAQVAADNPANLDPSDPNFPAGGGLNPNGTQCHQYDFDGNCIEGLEADPEPALQVAADGARIPPPSNCMSDAARNTWLTETPVQIHHIITQFENQAQPGASDVQIEKSLDVDRLQTIAAWYGLNWADGQWNLISIPHTGPHPPAYHLWLREQVAAIDTVAQGDPVMFLGLWNLLVRDTIASDPSIVGYDYWNCYG